MASDLYVSAGKALLLQGYKSIHPRFLLIHREENFDIKFLIQL